ncbi:hypothetical protein CAPTEDRAFT_206512, partial [Capitella teleta]
MRPTTTNEPDSIYVSKDDKIVIDGLLCYMVHKLHVLNQDALEKVIVSGYSNDAIRASKEKLFKVCPGQRYVGHTGEAAATKHVRDMIKLLQERGTAIPTFVSDSGSLSAMPPVTFDSMDVVSLLRRIQSTQEEVSAMKALMASQSETMGCVTKLTQDLSGREGNMEAIYVRSEDAPMQDNATEVMQSNEELKTAEDATAMKQVALDPLPATYTQVLKRRPRKKKVVPAFVDD